MSTRGTSTQGIARATGIPWETWTARLDALGARQMSHAQIARHVAEQLDGVVENNEWWAQSVTVAYEQHSGVRRPGQAGDGSFGVSTSRTLPGTRDEVLARWCELMAGCSDLDGVLLGQAPTTAVTEKWRYWRARPTDGTRVAVTIGDKGGGRTTIGVSHTGLVSPEDGERWRAYWKDRLNAL